MGAVITTIEAAEAMNNERKVIELEAGWAFMQKGITKLKNLLEGQQEQQFSSEEYMLLYTYATINSINCDLSVFSVLGFGELGVRGCSVSCVVVISMLRCVVCFTRKRKYGYFSSTQEWLESSCAHLCAGSGILM